MITDESLRAAIHDTIAKQILEGLATEHRDQLLRESLVKSLTSWDVRSAIEKVVAAKAAKVAVELCKSEEWSARIEEVIRDGFADYLVSLQGAIPTVLKSTLHGVEDRYPKCGSILGVWPKSE